MTTTRKYLKQYDLIISEEYGIEYSVPTGSLHVIEGGYNGNAYRVCLITYYDGVAHNFVGNLQQINKWIYSFD